VRATNSPLVFSVIFGLYRVQRYLGYCGRGRREKNYDTKGKACGVGGLVLISWFLEGFGDEQREGMMNSRKVWKKGRQKKIKNTTICSKKKPQPILNNSNYILPLPNTPLRPAHV